MHNMQTSKRVYSLGFSSDLQKDGHILEQAVSNLGVQGAEEEV